VLTERRKTGILATCCLCALITGMDLTIANLAIPSIRSDLTATAAHAQWVIAIYALVVASLQLLGGAAGDRFGRRRVLQIGIAIFMFGSLLCSLAPVIDMLIAARAVQAFGASMMNPVALAIIAQVFVGPAERARAMGIWGAVFGASLALGPVVGGFLIDSFGWRSVFWINLPVGAVAIALCALLVPQSRSATIRGIDPVGQGSRSARTPGRTGCRQPARAGAGRIRGSWRSRPPRYWRSRASCATSRGTPIHSSNCGTSARFRSLRRRSPLCSSSSSGEPSSS
jgi:MFS family permease